MATLDLALVTTKRLIEAGVKIIALPGGFFQLLGMYGCILLTNDIAALNARQLEQLCGVIAVS